MSDTITVQVQQDITIERVRGLLCSALEGGSNYWYYDLDYRLGDGMTISDFKQGGRLNPKPDSGYGGWTWPYVVATTKGCCLTLRVLDDKDGDYYGKTFVVDMETLARGLQKMADNHPEHFGNFLAENDDADTGDCFLQCCVFGEVVFG